MTAPTAHDVLILRLLKMGQFERRAGAWRFGTKKISDSVVDRLVASGNARRDADRVWLSTSGAAE